MRGAVVVRIGVFCVHSCLEFLHSTYSGGVVGLLSKIRVGLILLAVGRLSGLGCFLLGDSWRTLALNTFKQLILLGLKPHEVCHSLFIHFQII